MGDMNTFGFNTFDYLTPAVLYGGDDKAARQRLDAAAKDGDVTALGWRDHPALMNQRERSSRGSIATGARPAPSATAVPAAPSQAQIDAQIAAAYPMPERQTLGGTGLPVAG